MKSVPAARNTQSVATHSSEPIWAFSRLYVSKDTAERHDMTAYSIAAAVFKAQSRPTSYRKSTDS